jgi:hypothetical protein
MGTGVLPPPAGVLPPTAGPAGGVEWEAGR